MFILPRVNYVTEVLRQLSCTHKRIVAIVEYDHLEHIEEAWQKLPGELQSLESLIKVAKNYHGNHRRPTGNYLQDKLAQETFLEFVEKLAIMDVLFDPYIHENFIKLKSFPFPH